MGRMTTEMITWLYVSDVLRSRHFYEEALGLTLVLNQGDCCILSITDTAYLGLCQRAEPRETPGLLLCFVTDAVDEQVAALVSAGATLEQSAKNNEKYGIYHAFLLDPDGHRLEVQRFQNPDWNNPK